MVLGKKIRLIREEQGLNQSELADKLSITSRTLQNYEYGTSIPDIKLMQKMAQIFQVPIGYFLDDNFDVSSIKNDVSRVVSNDVSLKKAEKLQHLKNTISEQENKLINLRFFPSVSAAAGYGANNDNESFKNIPITASFLTDVLRIPARQYDVINVLGNSMEPFLKDGDMVLVLPTHEASNGEIVIANLGGDLYVKKLLKDPIKKRIRLTSMNELYEDIVVEDDELDQLKIVGVVKKVLPSGVISA
ncbi:LexA family transcriptional regulator [Campylobacter sp. RM9344]|uniref:LexA family transcriptional regulator n=1 Tax=Campylobacter californiensis TaxID=1032243 RepID=A0AAW3ZR52_9BACT|nr:MULTISPECIES: XRE family transcriptional regulator [unclassified Campylobacter]MBE2984676.1 LexA family transcriptional regulator [Campylobacter sp. RM6883]MBE2994592.1 LexA family transcriptional regulator [Campylobacter sp. RM6913]MBE3028859.1 LexA family transcriptional regulator [Campylobacter sp. RM9344]MBE3607217.1 LexA family transcriptional regulator [Campylobacter sp. RM9337]MBE3609483.1 LexA family transcriptional regulator [Campylobacter sp. RM12916]